MEFRVSSLGFRVWGFRVEGSRVSDHPGGNPEANLKPISHRCYLQEVRFEWDMTKETIYLPLGCLQGGLGLRPGSARRRGAPAKWRGGEYRV